MLLFMLFFLPEFLLAFTSFGAFTTLFHLAALCLATCWAFQFETVVLKSAPEFHDRDINSGMLET